MNMIIGIDVDGVLSDIGNYQLKYSKPYFKKKYNKDIVNPDKFDIEQIYDCTHKEREIFWQKYIWGYCLTEPAFKNASEVLLKLHEEENKIVIITGRAHTTEQGITGKLFRKMLTYWLKKNKIYYDEIYYCSEKESSVDKYDICQKLKTDVMIDDSPENLEAIKDISKVFCFTAAWNKNFECENMVRVNKWDEIYSAIHSL